MSATIRSFSFDEEVGAPSSPPSPIPAPDPAETLRRRLALEPEVLTHDDLLALYRQRYQERFGYDPVDGDEPGELPKARTVMAGFAGRYGAELGRDIINAVFDLHGGMWQGDPFNIGRFSRDSRWLTDKIRHQVLHARDFRMEGDDGDEILRRDG